MEHIGSILSGIGVILAGIAALIKAVRDNDKDDK